MIVRPGIPLIYVMPAEGGLGINIGDIYEDRHGRYIEVPLRDVPQLIKRLREVSREMKAPIVDDEVTE